jgi:DHA1 family bicyclomycin/chloramphenicol resistance-like MFS transporter
VFLSHAALGCASTFLLFTYVGGSPGVFVGVFGLDPGSFAILFGANAAGFILMSQFNPPLLLRFGPQRVVRWTTLIILAATLVLAFVAFRGPTSLWQVLAPLSIATSLCAIIMPNATVGALSRHAGHAGSASALQGTLQFGVAGCSGALLGWLADGSARPMAVLMLGAAIACVVAQALRPRS